MRKLIIVAAFALAGSADVTSLKDFWSTRAPDDPHFQSARSSLALEECIALEISEKVAVPNIIHGEHETIITGVTAGFSPVPIAGARIVDRGSSREILIGAVHSGGWREKVSAVAKGCA